MYRYRYHNIWIQVFVPGVPAIILGCSSDAGFLMNVTHNSTQLFPPEAVFHEWNWRSHDPATMMSYLEYVLIHTYKASLQSPGKNY